MENLSKCDFQLNQMNTKYQRQDEEGNFYNLSFNWFSDNFIEFFRQEIYGVETNVFLLIKFMSRQPFSELILY